VRSNRKLLIAVAGFAAAFASRAAVNVPLPHGWRVISADAFSPHDGKDLRIGFEARDGMLRLRLPKLALYQVVRVTGAPATVSLDR
jgi:hypothetical protein